MPPRRSSRLAGAQPDDSVVQDYVLDPRLVADVLSAVFALVPVDCRLRSREVSRAWKAFLDQPWLWQSCSLTAGSGLVAKPSCALLLAATARARGQLRELDVAGCHGFTFPTLLEVVEANRAALTTLRAWCAVCSTHLASLRSLRSLRPLGRACAFNANTSEDIEFLIDDLEMPQLFAAAEGGVLRAIECDVCPSPELAVAILRREPPYSALHVRRMRMEGEHTSDDDVITIRHVDVAALCEAMRGHASLRSLALSEISDSIPVHIDSLVDASLHCRLYSLSLYKCGVTAACLPALTRLLREGHALRTLHLSDEPLLRGPAVAAFLSALRDSGLTSLCLANVDLFGALEEDPHVYAEVLADGLDLLYTLWGHRSLEELYIPANYAESCEDEFGAAVARLLAGRPQSALRVLDVSDCGLGDEASFPIFAALSGNTCLRRLDYRLNVVSPRCAAMIVETCLPRNRSLASLRFLDELDVDEAGEPVPLLPDLVRAEEMVKARGIEHVHTPH